MLSGDEATKRKRPISPPVIKRRKLKPRESQSATARFNLTPSAVESGSALIVDHLAFYSAYLSSSLRADFTLLPIPGWQSLYKRNQHPHGHHFVIHQHDHPKAGTHYDLRLQINETSSCSWAIMYGLPGNPNSTHLNRNATETRVHCLWNHLIESASLATGSLLIWDTGEYEVLPSVAPDSDLTDQDIHSQQIHTSEPDKLAEAFARGKLYLRLHGSCLPKDYVLYIRRPKNAALKDRPPAQRRRRKTNLAQDRRGESGDDKAHSDVDEDATIRRENAYPGASNTIGSVHQRTWYASMDRVRSGFRKTRKDGDIVWTKDKDDSAELEGGFEPFFVRGREYERSVVTGRLAGDIMQDEGICGYIPRPGWRPVLE